MIEPHEALVNVTYRDGINFDLPDPVQYAATEGEIKGMVAEAIRTGSVANVAADPNVDLANFRMERVDKPTLPGPNQREHNMILLRPKTAYGPSTRWLDCWP
jgi:hypothetical protein